MGRWVGGSVGRWVGGPVGRWVDGSVGRCMSRSVDRWISGSVGYNISSEGYFLSKTCLPTKTENLTLPKKESKILKRARDVSKKRGFI